MNNIKGKPCSILNFVPGNSTNPNASIVCQVPANQNSTFTEYAGNRGITLIVDYVYSPNLTTALPSNNATYSEINMASYQATNTGVYTIWLKGFLAPKTASRYEFEIISNGNSALFISKDNTSAKKVKIKNLYHFIKLTSKMRLSI